MSPQQKRSTRDCFKNSSWFQCLNGTIPKLLELYELACSSKCWTNQQKVLGLMYHRGWSLLQGIVSTLWSWHMLKLGPCNFSALILNVLGDVDGMDVKWIHVVWMVWTVWRVWMIWIVWIVWNDMDLLMEMNTDRWVIYLIWILNNTTTHPVLPDLGLWNDSQVGTQFWKCEGFDTSLQVDWFFTCFEHLP